MTISPSSEKKILEAIKDISVSIAVIDERLTNHLQVVHDLKEETKVQAKKIEQTELIVLRHALFFKAFAWLMGLFASGLGLKAYLKF